MEKPEPTMYKFLILFCLVSCLLACASRDLKHPVPVSQGNGSPSPISPSQSPSPTPHVNREELALASGLRIVRREINLTNDKRRYKISVAYPEIEGHSNKWSSVLNREIKRLVTKTYQWLLQRPTKDELLQHSKWSGVFNSVDMEYDVVEANDRFLSIYFMGYHYGIGAAHSVHESFTVNYDLQTNQILTFTSLFKSKSQVLKLISKTCLEELTKSVPYLSEDSSFADRLKPKTKNFESWNLTARGLMVNFDACEVAACAEGDVQVEISFVQLTEISRPGSVLIM